MNEDDEVTLPRKDYEDLIKDNERLGEEVHYYKEQALEVAEGNLKLQLRLKELNEENEKLKEFYERNS